MKVSVIAEDKMVIVDGEAFEIDLAFPSDLWAIQWDGKQGHFEWRDKVHTEAKEHDLLIYIEAWQAAKDVQLQALDELAPIQLTDQEKINIEARQALADSDWRAIRALERKFLPGTDLNLERDALRASVID